MLKRFHGTIYLIKLSMDLNNLSNFHVKDLTAKKNKSHGKFYQIISNEWFHENDFNWDYIPTLVHKAFDSIRQKTSIERVKKLVN